MENKTDVNVPKEQVKVELRENDILQTEEIEIEEMAIDGICGVY